MYTTNSTDVNQRIDNLGMFIWQYYVCILPILLFIIDRYIPYIISVSAVTGGGTGMSVNATNFTQQGSE